MMLKIRPRVSCKDGCSFLLAFERLSSWRRCARLEVRRRQQLDNDESNTSHENDRSQNPKYGNANTITHSQMRSCTAKMACSIPKVNEKRREVK